MASIGSIMIGVKASSSAFSKGIKSTRNTLKGFGKSLFSVKGAVLGLAGAFGLSVGFRAFTSQIKNAMQSMDRMAKRARQLQTSFGELAGLNLAAQLAGTDQGTVEKSLDRLQRSIGEATIRGTGLAADAFQQLGIDASTFGNNAVQNFTQVADRLAGVDDANQRAYLSQQLFGRGAAELQTLIAGGSGVIQDAINDIRSWGGAFADLDTAQIEMANDQITKMKTVFQILVSQVAVKLAPVLKAATARVTEFLSESSGTGKLNGLMEFLVKAIGLGADVIQVFGFAFKGVSAALSGYIGGVIKIWSYFVQGIEAVTNLLPGLETNFGDTMSAMGDAIMDEAGKQFEELKQDFIAPPPSEKIAAAFDGLRSEAKTAAQDMVDAFKKGGAGMAAAVDSGMAEAIESLSKFETKLADQIATFGMTSEAAEIFRLQQAGISEDSLSGVREMAAKLDELRGLEEQNKRAESIKKAVQTPLEAYQETMKELQELTLAGVLDSTTLKRAQEDALEKLNESTKTEKGDTKFASAALAGTAEARSLILASRFGNKKQDKVEENTGKSAEFLQQILAALTGQDPLETLLF